MLEQAKLDRSIKDKVHAVDKCRAPAAPAAGADSAPAESGGDGKGGGGDGAPSAPSRDPLGTGPTCDQQ
eukprot:1188368-Prorocentrum_minimum.AAC.1